jgi:triosephosphate isomerase (TIM)
MGQGVIMSDRRILIGANWKMNLSVGESSILLKKLHDVVRMHKNIDVVLAPNMLALQPLSVQADHRRFKLMAQNAHFKDEGAHTGEVSMHMLRGIAQYVIIGHSERRAMGETLDIVRDKVAAAFRNGITPWLCVGETKQERTNGEMKQVIHDQIMSALSNLTAPEVSKMVIAYEPIWAIGTGEVAVPDQATEAAQCIRHNVTELYGKQAGESVRILYGGSVKATNARSFLDAKDVDGLFVGGASLNHLEFADIIQAAYRSLHNLQAN